jgi:hypothetical protein
MFFSNIKKLCQCRLYGAAGNPQEITVNVIFLLIAYGYICNKMKVLL